MTGRCRSAEERHQGPRRQRARPGRRAPRRQRPRAGFPSASATPVVPATRPWRPAPRSSRSRALARASISVARFPQVMRSTSPVRPRSSESDVPCGSRSRLTPRPAGDDAESKAAISVDEPGVVPGRNRGLEEARAQRPQVFVGARDRPIRLEPAHDRQPPAVPLVDPRVQEGGGADGQRDIEGLPDFQTGERRRRHTDDGERLIQKRERASYGGLATAQVRLPERMTDHRRSGAASSAIVIRPEQPSTFGRDAEHRKEVAAHPEPARASVPRRRGRRENSASPQANIAEKALWWARISSHNG